MTTRAQWEAMTDEERERDERIALIMSGVGCDEETAIEIADMAQMGLFDNKERK